MAGTKVRAVEYTELAALFFLQAMAMGMWMVPLSRVLTAHGYSSLRPYAFATYSIAGFISPLIFGAMADRHVSPVRVLRWLATASALALAVATSSIGAGWPGASVIILIQVYSICAAPTGSIATTIVFSHLKNSQKEFGPIRAMATSGWIAGCWIISGLNADSTTLAGYAGAVAWLGLSAFTHVVPGVPPPVSAEHVSLRERMGWDALVLLRNHDHRVVFVTVALFSIPLAAFYPFTPEHLRQLGLLRTSAWMTLGQVTEIITMFALAGLLARWRLKWIFATGLCLGVLRYALCALDTRLWVLLGVTLHGASFTLVFITAQIYLNERVDSAWRGRAQALMWLMNGGIGNLVGYLGSGFWMSATTSAHGTNWSLFWSGLSFAMAAVLGYFLIAYHGQGTGIIRKPSPHTLVSEASGASSGEQ